MADQMTHPEMLSNDHTGREFLRADLAATAQEARRAIAARLGIDVIEVGLVELVTLVADPAKAYEMGAEAWYVPTDDDEAAGAAAYWQTVDA